MESFHSADYGFDSILSFAFASCLQNHISLFVVSTHWMFPLHSASSSITHISPSLLMLMPRSCHLLISFAPQLAAFG